jgi:hypothetical protein
MEKMTIDPGRPALSSNLLYTEIVHCRTAAKIRLGRP